MMVFNCAEQGEQCSRAERQLRKYYMHTVFWFYNKYWLNLFVSYVTEIMRSVRSSGVSSVRYTREVRAVI